MSFLKAYAATMGSEGGYSNNPKDSGGETYKGVARNMHPEWVGWAIIDESLKHGEPLEAAPGLEEAIQQFYFDEFWKPLKCDLIDPVAADVAAELFEASVNCGAGNGVRFLQRSLNALNVNGTLWPDLTVDGAMGPGTLRTTLTCLTKRPPSILLKCMNGEQYIHYKNWSRHEDFPGVFERT